MKRRIWSQPDFFAGLTFIAFAVAFGAMASRYRFGSAVEMGPAYFPIVLSVLLTIIGAIITIRSFSALDRDERIDPVAIKPLVLILGSVSLFAALLMPLGLVLTSILLVALSAWASHEFDWKVTLVAAVGLAAACYGIFIFGLNLPMPVWPEIR